MSSKYLVVIFNGLFLISSVEAFSQTITARRLPCPDSQFACYYEFPVQAGTTETPIKLDASLATSEILSPHFFIAGPYVKYELGMTSDKKAAIAARITLLCIADHGVVSDRNLDDPYRASVVCPDTVPVKVTGHNP